MNELPLDMDLDKDLHANAPDPSIRDSLTTASLGRRRQNSCFFLSGARQIAGHEKNAAGRGELPCLPLLANLF
jgi:hypothetical protein